MNEILVYGLIGVVLLWLLGAVYVLSKRLDAQVPLPSAASKEQTAQLVGELARLRLSIGSHLDRLTAHTSVLSEVINTVQPEPVQTPSISGARVGARTEGQAGCVVTLTFMEDAETLLEVVGVRTYSALADAIEQDLRARAVKHVGKSANLR